MGSMPRLRLPVLAAVLTLLLISLYVRFDYSHPSDTWEPVGEISIPKAPHESVDLTPAPKDSSQKKPFAFFADAPPTNEPSAEPSPEPAEEPAPPPAPLLKPKFAVVTSVWDYKFASLALMLGWSVQKHTDLSAAGAELVLLTLESGEAGAVGLTTENRTRLEKAGWHIRTESRLKVPGVNESQIISHRRLNLNKLKIFGWDEYEKIVFMDADTVCKGDISELFRMPGDFAAAPDVWHDIAIDSRFNSGVMVFKPSQWTFNNMIEKLVDPTYHDPKEGDQSFLQAYWRYKNWGLPFKYNLNLIMHEHWRKEWDHLWMDAKIVHFTIRKPVEVWRSPGHCKKPLMGKGDRPGECVNWVALQWYAKQFKEMQSSLGFENEIGLLG